VDIKKARILKGSLAVIPDCYVTENAVERMVGLLPRRKLPAGEALWIPRCTSIHTFFMRFPIDAAFLDKSGEVIAIYRALQPWRLSWFHPFAAGVLEAGGGALSGVQKGEVLTICPIS
jgi:uncharacterized membrane protein (UPF0127 family)